jgi:hypothetical protein
LNNNEINGGPKLLQLASCDGSKENFSVLDILQKAGGCANLEAALGK